MGSQADCYFMIYKIMRRSIASSILFLLLFSGHVPFSGAIKPLEPSSVPTFAELSDLRGRSRYIAVFTTASMPWMTGTAINPLLRAVYLEMRKEQHSVTLCLPWVSLEQQPLIFGNLRFKSPSEQAEWIRDWVKKNLGRPTSIKLVFYEGWYVPIYGSIFALGDITEIIPESERDVVILEEPEHLTWYHMGNDWTKVFNFVVGVVHTNYINYAINDHQVPPPMRLARAAVLGLATAMCTRAYCHRIIKLSEAVQKFPHSVTCNIHGVRSNFIDIGVSKMSPSIFGSSRFSKGTYFIGKMLWSKGYRQLFVNLKELRRMTGENLHVDIFGSGPDEELIKKEVKQEGLDWTFHGACDHANSRIHDFKVMINPSLSDVVCTTTAEALAMGKFVVCADHPSNEFFKTFRNCFVYSNAKEFKLCIQHAMAADPAPLTENDRYRLSWEAATERLYDAAYTGSRRSRKLKVAHQSGGRQGVTQLQFDRILARTHKKMASWDIMRNWLPASSSEPGKPLGQKWEFGRTGNLKGRVLLGSSFLAVALLSFFKQES